MDELHEVLERFAASGNLMPPHIVGLNDLQVPKARHARGRGPSGPGSDQHGGCAVRPSAGGDLRQLGLHRRRMVGVSAGLLRLDGSRKPSYEALKQRIRSDWHTKLELATDESGCVEIKDLRG